MNERGKPSASRRSRIDVRGKPVGFVSVIVWLDMVVRIEVNRVLVSSTLRNESKSQSEVSVIENEMTDL